MNHFDAVIIGSGQAAPSLAVGLANRGQSVALIEGDKLPLARLTARVVDAQAGNAETPVVISADKSVKYEAVVRVMDALQRSGVKRVGLAVKNAGT